MQEPGGCFYQKEKAQFIKVYFSELACFEVRAKNYNIKWTPISFYVGTFDGQGHTISGLQVTQSDFATNGMFRMIKEGGCVKNLRLENPMVTGTKSNTSNGAIVGQLGRGGQIIGCTVSDATISGSLAGGIAGSTSGGGGTYDGVAKVDGTWNTAVEAMNKALEGTKCTYRYGITGSTPTLGPDSGAKALARLFNLTWPL